MMIRQLPETLGASYAASWGANEGQWPSKIFGAEPRQWAPWILDDFKQHKKLSYRRDSARRRSWRRSGSSKIADLGTNRKPVCDFRWWI